MTQYLSTIVPSASAIAAINATTQQVAALSLAAGDWYVTGEVWFGVTAGTPTINWLAAALSPVSAGPLSDPADNIAGAVVEPNQPRQTGATVGGILPLTSTRYNLAAAGTVYLNAQANWTGAGGMSLYGKIAARGTPATGIISSGPFVYVHLSDGSWEGYINLALCQWVRPNATTGSILQIESRVIDVIEAPDAIVGAV
jgi:hypothetical protein